MLYQRDGNADSPNCIAALWLQPEEEAIVHRILAQGDRVLKQNQQLLRILEVMAQRLKPATADPPSDIAKELWAGYHAALRKDGQSFAGPPGG